MQEPLFKIYRRKPRVELVTTEMMEFEVRAKQYAKEIAPLVSDEYEIGIEIEIEGVKPNNVTNYGVWQSKPDGSLRNNGIEYISVPMKGKRIHYALNYFFDTINKDSTFSPRTSIHVHLNVLPLTPNQIGGLVMTFLPFEKLFYRFVGKDRDKNNFCVPIGESSVNHILKFFIGETFTPPNWEHNRYLGLNIASVIKLGSLEFRHMPGTFDREKIVKWINLLFCLRKFAENNTMSEIKERIDRLNTDSSYHVFFNDVFGECGSSLDSRSLAKDMPEMVSIVKKLIVKNEFLNEIMGVINPKSHFIKVLEFKEKIKAEDAYMFFPVPQVHARPARDAARAVRDPGRRGGVLFGARVNIPVPPPPAPAAEEALNIRLNDWVQHAAQRLDPDNFNGEPE